MEGGGKHEKGGGGPQGNRERESNEKREKKERREGGLWNLAGKGRKNGERWEGEACIRYPKGQVVEKEWGKTKRKKGGWRWKAEVVGLATTTTKKKRRGLGSHSVEREGNRENRQQKSKAAEDGEEKAREGDVKEKESGWAHASVCMWRQKELDRKQMCWGGECELHMHHRKRHEAPRELLRQEQIPLKPEFVLTRWKRRREAEHTEVYLLVGALCSCCLSNAAMCLPQTVTCDCACV